MHLTPLTCKSHGMQTYKVVYNEVIVKKMPLTAPGFEPASPPFPTNGSWPLSASPISAQLAASTLADLAALASIVLQSRPEHSQGLYIKLLYIHLLD